MRIIVDAMGGDNAPLAIIKGALRGQKRWGVDITLAGDEAAIRDALYGKEIRGSARGACGNRHTRC